VRLFYGTIGYREFNIRSHGHFGLLVPNHGGLFKVFNLATITRRIFTV